MQEEFIKWLQEGILDKIISLKTAEELYTAIYEDFEGEDFESFIFSF